MASLAQSTVDHAFAHRRAPCRRRTERRRPSSAARFRCTLVAIVCAAAASPAQDMSATHEPAPLVKAGDDAALAGDYKRAYALWKRAYFVRLPMYRSREFRYGVRVRLLSPDAFRASLVAFGGSSEATDETARCVGVRLGYFDKTLDYTRARRERDADRATAYFDPDRKEIVLPVPAKPPSTTLMDLVFGRHRLARQRRLEFVHEMTHALSDQHFDLLSMMTSTRHDRDMMLAYRAVVEGEAMITMLMAMNDDLVGPSYGLLLNAAYDRRFFSRLVGLGMSTPRSSPLIFNERRRFPYADGLRFVGRLVTTDTWEWIDYALRSPPLSTEQILHPEKYHGPVPDTPTAIAFQRPFPLDGPWELLEENTVGEFGLEVLLRPRLGRRDSRRAAAGWDGDTYRVYRLGPSARPAAHDPDPPLLLAWSTTWDSSADAREAAEAFVRFYEIDHARPFDALLAWRAFAAGLVDECFAGVWLVDRHVTVLLGVPRECADRVTAWSHLVSRTPKRLVKKRVVPFVSYVTRRSL